jgi:polysaccharide biosynthesis protein PslH
MSRILFITHALPFPPHLGGNQRTALLQRALNKHGQTDLLFVSRYGQLPQEMIEEGRKNHGLVESVALPRRGSLPPWNLIRRISPKIVDRFATAFGTQAVWYRPDAGLSAAVQKALAARQYDVIISRHLYPAAMSGILQHPPGLPVIVDADDVDHIVAEENGHPSVPFYKRVAFSRQTRQIRREALPLFAKATHLWVAAAQDAADLDASRCSLVPNIPYQAEGAARVPCPPARESLDILVVASIGYNPNSEGVEYFLKRVWPAIRREVGGANLRIVGSGVSPARIKRWSSVPGVEVVGFVPDLREEYQRSAFSIVPVQRGGGTKIKAIECFTFGRTCVVTPHSYRGIGEVLKHQQSLWRGENDEHFAEGCIHLLTHPEDRDAWAENGRQLVAREFNFEKLQAAVDQTFAKLGLASG